MRRARDTESGMSMVVTVLILMFLLGLGLAVVWYTSLQVGAARNLNSRDTALNAAHAGIQHARSVLALTTDWSDCIKTHSNANDAIPDQLNPTRKGAVLYDACPGPGTTGCLGTVPVWDCAYAVNAGDGGQVTLGSYRVWVRNDPGEILAGKPVTDTNTSVIVRSEGRDANGMSVVVVEAGLARSWAAAADPNKYGLGKNVNAFNTSAAAGAVDWNK
jgi:Tfp pilus assembly protein PilX